jgi:hypothetical protein
VGTNDLVMLLIRALFVPIVVLWPLLLFGFDISIQR